MTDAGQREVLALMLRTNALAVAEVLVGSEAGTAYSTLGALAATRSLGLVVDDILQTLARQARSEGATWQQIGEVMQTTRQNAYQRFGANAPRDEGIRSMDDPHEGKAVAKEATELFKSVAAEDWDSIFSRLNDDMKERLTETMLQSGWRQTSARLGSFTGLGKPNARTIGGQTVVDVPMSFAKGEMKGRVSYDADGRVAGLFILDPEVA